MNNRIGDCANAGDYLIEVTSGTNVSLKVPLESYHHMEEDLQGSHHSQIFIRIKAGTKAC
jgi:hypothetical protein